MTSTPTTSSTTKSVAAASAPPNRSSQDGPCAFECPICFGIPLDPTLTPECEHIFCHSCITQALHHSKHCPTCRAPITHGQLKRLERGSMLYRMWSQIPVQCRNSDLGCRWTGSVSEYQSHVWGCEQCQVLVGGTMKNNDCEGEVGEEKVSCDQYKTKQPQQDSSSRDGHHRFEKSIMAARREKTWTLQLGVLERQQKNLENLLEEQRKMISRLKQENERNPQPCLPHVVLKNQNQGMEDTTASTTSFTNDMALPLTSTNTILAPTTTRLVPSCDAVQVTGAGVEQVNGIYKRTGSWDNVGLFTKKDIWQDNREQTFTLYRCSTYNNSKRWCISILPTTTTTTVFDASACNSHSACCTAAVDIDFYQQEASGMRDEVPGMLSCQWVSVGGGNVQKGNPPSVTYLPAI